MAVRFYLNTRRDTGQRPVGVAVVVLRGQRQVKVLTPVRVCPKDWSKRQQRLKPSAPRATELNAALARLKADVERMALDHPRDDALREALRVRLGRAVQDEQPAILDLFDAFYAMKETRTRKSTVQVYAALRKHLENWLGTDADLQRIGSGFLEDFGTYLAGQGLANSTVNKLATRARGFMAWLESRGHIGKLPETKPLPTARNPALYLTADELAELIRLDLSGEQRGYQAARDLFIVGSVTGQRFSDIEAMDWEHLDLKAGWWHLSVKKKAVTLRVPLTTPVRRIIEARTGEDTPLPRLSNQKANAYLKEVCRMAGIDAPVSVQVLRGARRETSTRPKWEVISTHAARKTFVTLALQQGVPMSELLGFTHDDLRTLRLYAGSNEEIRRNQMDRVFGTL